MLRRHTLHIRRRGVVRRYPVALVLRTGYPFQLGGLALRQVEEELLAPFVVRVTEGSGRPVNALVFGWVGLGDAREIEVGWDLWWQVCLLAARGPPGSSAVLC